MIIININNNIVSRPSLPSVKHNYWGTVKDYTHSWLQQFIAVLYGNVYSRHVTCKYCMVMFIAVM